MLRKAGRGRGLAFGCHFPRRRADDTLAPDFRAVLETDDGATILCSWQGYGRTTADCVRQLVSAITHLSDAERPR